MTDFILVVETGVSLGKGCILESTFHWNLLSIYLFQIWVSLLLLPAKVHQVINHL